MQLKILLLLGVLWSLEESTFGYTIPNVQLEITNNGFRVFIPDEPGINHVFYAISINNQCPPILDLVSEAVSGQWTSDLSPIRLIDGNQLEISIMTSIENQVHTVTQYLEIENKRVKTIEKTDNNKLLENDCDVEAFTLALSQSTCDKNIGTRSFTHSVQCVGNVLFEDNFDGNGVDSNKWDIINRILLNRKDTEEFTAITDSSMNLFTENGILHIKPTISRANIQSGTLSLGDKCEPLRDSFDCEVSAQSSVSVLPPVYSAMLETKKRFTFQYGHIEIRAKLPQGDWLFPYLILENLDLNRNVYHPTQIRIAFVRGNSLYLTEDNEDIGGSKLYGGLVYWNGNNRMETFGKKSQSQHFGNDFHVYSLKWHKNNTITLGVDGKTYGELNDLDSSKLDGQFYIKLGVSAGGYFEYPESTRSSKPWSNTDPRSPNNFWRKKRDWQSSWNGNEALLVDYIRVYAV